MSSTTADVVETPADVVVAPEEEPQRSSPAIAPVLRHPAVMAGFVFFPMVAFGVYGFEPQALVTAVTAVVLVALAAIDAEHRVLPNRIVLPAIVVLLVMQVGFFADRALEWPLAGLAAAAFLALPLLVRRDAMGMGDIKLGVLLGVAAGWSVFGAIVIGCLAMLPAALYMLRRDSSLHDATLPFGPFLALGTLVVMYIP